MENAEKNSPQHIVSDCMCKLPLDSALVRVSDWTVGNWEESIMIEGLWGIGGWPIEADISLESADSWRSVEEPLEPKTYNSFYLFVCIYYFFIVGFETSLIYIGGENIVIMKKYTYFFWYCLLSTFQRGGV